MTDMSNSMQFLLVGSLQPDVLSGSEPEINRLLEEERAPPERGYLARSTRCGCGRGRDY